MDPFTTLFFMLLGAISLTKMWSDSEIFRPIRNWMSDYKWLQKPWLCACCTSFWMGVLSSLLIGDPFFLLGVKMGVSTAFCGLTTHFVTCLLINKNIF